MSAVWGSVQAAVVESQQRLRIVGRPALLVGGCILAWGFAELVARGNPPIPAHDVLDDPSLVRLLRTMALIKGAFDFAVVAAVGWRLTRPIGFGASLGYLVGACSMLGATVLIWELTLLPIAAALFHGGLCAVLVVAWRDDRRPWPRGWAVRSSA